MWLQMAVKAGQAPHGFVLFASSAHAHQALEAIAGVPFSIAVAAGPIGSSSQHQVELSGNRSAAPPRTTVVDEEYVNLKSHLPQPIPGTVNTLSGGGNSGTQSTTSNLVSLGSVLLEILVATRRVGALHAANLMLDVMASQISRTPMIILCVISCYARGLVASTSMGCWRQSHAS